MRYTQIPTNTFEQLQLNAGILVDTFDPETGAIGNLLGATTGGITFESHPTYTDYGEDVDNCPNNMKELKQLEYFDPVISGTFLTVSPASIASLIGAGDEASGHIIPRAVLLDTDFSDLWWIGDYSDKNTGAAAGYIAIHMKNALNTSGFKIQSTKGGKGQLAFEYHAHYSIDAQDEVPFEVYVKEGEEAEPTYEAATLTAAGFKYGVTYFTRTGAGTEGDPYVYHEVTAGTAYNSATTYYVRTEA